MPKITYIEHKFTNESLRLIKMANEIIAEYQADNLVLTLRQLFYQYVSRGMIENTLKSYKRLGSVINDGRMAGAIDWDAIEDRTRNVKFQSHWHDPENMVESAAQWYATDKWADQPYRVEVWIEKEALAGILDGPCAELDVSYFCCRGYVSQSEQWRSAMRLRRYADRGQKPIVIHLGDHDPSGIDMTRDNRDRFYGFGADVEVERIALNMNQIEEFNPPPNFAKLSDSRAKEYVAEFGTDSWELDALEPRYLQKIITEKVLSYRDEDLWNAAVKKQEEERAQLRVVADNFEDVMAFVEDQQLQNDSIADDED